MNDIRTLTISAADIEAAIVYGQSTAAKEDANIYARGGNTLGAVAERCWLHWNGYMISRANMGRTAITHTPTNGPNNGMLINAAVVENLLLIAQENYERLVGILRGNIGTAKHLIILAALANGPQKLTQGIPLVMSITIVNRRSLP